MILEGMGVNMDENKIDIKEIENDINNQLGEMYELIVEDCEFNSTFDLALHISECVIKTLSNYKEILDKPKGEMVHLIFLEIIDLVDSFYKKFNIDVNIHELINNGTIGVISDDYEKMIPLDKIESDGHCAFKGEEPVFEEYVDEFGREKMDFWLTSPRVNIELNQTGTLEDALTLVHELSHARDKLPLKKGDFIVTLNRKFFTESLADTEAFIFLNNLDESFNYDKSEIIRERLNYYYEVALRVVYFLKIIITYRDYHLISEETFKMNYPNDDYLSIIKESKGKKAKDYFRTLTYLLCPVVSIQGVKLQEKDENFITIAQELHSKIVDSSLIDYFSYLSLPNEHLDELLNVVETNLTEFCEKELIESNKIQR